MEQNRCISLLGSTGSIGRQSLDVIAACGMRVAALTANRDVEQMEKQCRRFQPELAVMMDPEAAASLRLRLADTPIRVAEGMEGLLEAASLEAAEHRCYDNLLQYLGNRTLQNVEKGYLCKETRE